MSPEPFPDFTWRGGNYASNSNIVIVELLGIVDECLVHHPEHKAEPSGMATNLLKMWFRCIFSVFFSVALEGAL